MLGMAEVFVLLLGEIDLSVGYRGAVGAAVMANLAAPPHNVGWALAILAGLAGMHRDRLRPGLLITRLRLPSFVVTLAGLLVWEGVLIWLDQQPEPDQRRHRSASPTP